MEARGRRSSLANLRRVAPRGHSSRAELVASETGAPNPARVPVLAWQTWDVARTQPTVTIDQNLIEVARAVAERAGVPESEVYERALRRVLVEDFRALLDDIAQRQQAAGIVLSEGDADRIAVDEVRAYRAERRNAS